MAKYELKTKKNNDDVDEFIANVSDEQKRRDSIAITTMMQRITGQPPKMWGESIIGFGSYHYKNKASEGDWMAIGFSPRKQNLTLYLSCDLDELRDQLENLGTFTRGVGCLYIKKLDDVNDTTLRELIDLAYRYAKTKLDVSSDQL